MSEQPSSAQNIKLTPQGDIAPTPQNTPAAHLSHSVMSRPQVPSTLSEEVGEDDEEIPVISSGAAAGLAGLASNPAFASLVQGRLSSLVGRSSGYIESLPAPVRRRITGLKGVQAEHAKIEAEFQKEIFELEKKFAEKYRPLYEKRRALIEGSREPSKDEIEKGEKEEDEDEEDFDSEDEDEEPRPRERIPEPTAEELASAPKGIPEFWLTALKNHLGLSELITERDEEALKFLIDVRLSYPTEKPGFTLVFEFEEGAKAFFSNTTLEKTYYYQDEVGYEGDFVYDHAVGTEIQWVEGKNLTVRVETKKQRNKNTNQTRIVKKVVPTDSFFSFFTPPVPPEDEDEDIEEDIDEKLELDYQIGEDLKERVIPRAIDFFTGKALRYEQGDGDFDSEDDDEFDEDEEDSDDDEPRGSVRKAPAPPSGNTPASHQDPQECKQS
ncbi:nucleosome assembly protein 1-like 1 [Pseudohyphozyma bogoriensis]|nr:nucleosome assembly protein 1-like 1 [Pseudohyphozyma bogoriensis]